MPGGRKQQKNQLHLKSSSYGYVHPSLEGRLSAQSQNAIPQEASTKSVNARIEYLRRTQSPRVSAASLEDFRLQKPSPSVPNTRVAGPPAPRSWLDEGASTKRTFKYGAQQRGNVDHRPPELHYFPGGNMPEKTSLVHHALRSMAAAFAWHIEYDHIYLSMLPIELKHQLLSYIAYYGPENGITITGLRSLFASEDASGVPDSAGTESLERLDLGGSVGRGFTLRQLDKYWQITKPKSSRSMQEPLDSWELSMSPTSHLRFATLTRLSLAYPGPTASWVDLLALSHRLGALTHLSLAHWPIPELSEAPDSSLPSTSAAAAQRDSGNYSEAAYILKQFSRATSSLQYLSFEGCSSWSAVLRHVPPPSSTRRRATRYSQMFDNPIPSSPLTPSSPGSRHITGEGVEWAAAWRHITHLRLSQGWIPKEVDPSFLFQLKNARGKLITPPTTTASVIPAPFPEATSILSLHNALPPTPRDTPAPDSMVRPRNFPLPASRMPPSARPVPSSTNEHYMITAPDSIATAIQAAHRRRQWCEFEIEALEVEAWIRRCRRQAGEKVCVVEHGWNREDLEALGYDEGVLFTAGF